MNELISITLQELSGAIINTCNARDLWKFVESKREFSHWIKSRIESYGFVEGEDFMVDKFVTQYNQVDSWGRQWLNFQQPTSVKGV